MCACDEMPSLQSVAGYVLKILLYQEHSSYKIWCLDYHFITGLCGLGILYMLLNALSCMYGLAFPMLVSGL